jgi:hypothetical protein
MNSLSPKLTFKLQETLKALFLAATLQSAFTEEMRHLSCTTSWIPFQCIQKCTRGRAIFNEQAFSQIGERFCEQFFDAGIHRGSFLTNEDDVASAKTVFILIQKA